MLSQFTCLMIYENMPRSCIVLPVVTRVIILGRYMDAFQYQYIVVPLSQTLKKYIELNIKFKAIIRFR